MSVESTPSTSSKRCRPRKKINKAVLDREIPGISENSKTTCNVNEKDEGSKKINTDVAHCKSSQQALAQECSEVIAKLKISLNEKKETRRKRNKQKTTGANSEPTSSLNTQHSGKEVEANEGPLLDLAEELSKQDDARKYKRRTRKRASKAKKTEPSTNEDTDSETIVECHYSKGKGRDKKENGTKAKEVSTKKHTFPNYLPLAELRFIIRECSPTTVQYIEDYLRINPRFWKHAYVSMSDEDSDLLIVGLIDRNRAMDGDLVIARVNPPEEWQKNSGGKIQKTGVVVHIVDKVHPRKAIGYLEKQKSFAYFWPRDKRIPFLKIYPESLPRKFMEDPDLCKDTLYLANITSWRSPRNAVGKIIEAVGTTGDIKAESSAILLENDLDVTPYSKEAMDCISNINNTLTDEDLNDRDDWRNECVFTIDPDTAVDLDDAVSCKLLENGNYEIGVHISDVTHYLEFFSPLDIEVSKRATTVYLTDNVFHMLPKELCQLCSLLPGEDKLAFSVIWEMTPDANIVSHRFAKTVIRSACQMAYQHAQSFIENPDGNWPDDFLNIKGDYTVRQLADIVNDLQKLAKQLRDRRFAGGALRIDQPKLYVVLDRDTGLPASYSIEEQKDSNRLIEELMLLANMTVATHLYKEIPETALLRNHRPPSKLLLKGTKEMLQRFGIILDIESAGSLQASIKRYEIEMETEAENLIQKYNMMVINNLCSKAMSRALYKCSATVSAEDDLWHYALNVPLYTHFTSPIRRYSDVVVHRLLYSTMQEKPLSEEWSRSLCSKIAANCNLKKYSAKVAQQQSNELFFTYLTGLRGPFVTVAIAVDIKESSMDVLLCEIGIKLRVYFAEIKHLAKIQYSNDNSVPTISVTWKEDAVKQMINVFSILHLRIEKHPDLFRLVGFLVPPKKKTASE